ncbi:30S ribosomal protein S12 methylthiotransferase RimO [Limisalsivibrio acetivorans]|uniref:30S ribosomal protein S12 methylthiotransferase RimO n=1 Tax=Limisalsivibrio acetivorans TaxID=1304888 RepID=UPI0003B67B01|nr:30S ribosomal protein S12 methylthiotransferase RimO [Limisalsivibrio acetivorans]
MKVAYISLGCSKNRVDLEYLIGELNEQGHEITVEIPDADLLVVNTCGFIEPAVTEAVETIVESAQALKPGAKLAVTGCMTERYMDEIADELPEIDFHTGAGRMDDLLAWLDGRRIKSTQNYRYDKPRVLTTPSYYAYLKIADGCSNRCSYCTIPSIRGKLTSRRMEDIVDEAVRLTQSGVKELVIVSQDSTKYGSDIYGKPKLIELINKLDNVDGDFYIRLMYLNPDGVTEELVEKVNESGRIISYYDMPVQHFSDEMLKKMNRRSSSADIAKVFHMIREKNPDAFIRTTAIVGFPGESEEDFDKLLSFIKEYKPDFAGFFPYYREEGTPAAEIDIKMDGRNVRGRIGKLRRAQERNTVERLKKLKKNDILCFAEKTNEDFDFLIEGRAMFQAPEVDGKVIFTAGTADSGAGPYTCTIDKIVYPDLYCMMVGEEEI